MNFTKATLAIALATLSVSSFSMSSMPRSEEDVRQANQNCANGYQRGVDMLKDTYNDFNDGRMSNFKFATTLAAISTGVSVDAGVCRTFNEAPKYRPCLNALEKNYNKVRGYAKIMPVLTGAQSEVSHSIFEFLGDAAGTGKAGVICELAGIDLYNYRR